MAARKGMFCLLLVKCIILAIALFPRALACDEYTAFGVTHTCNGIHDLLHAAVLATSDIPLFNSKKPSGLCSLFEVLPLVDISYLI